MLNNGINLPNFDIDINQTLSKLEKVIEKNTSELDQLLTGNINGWDLMYKLDELDARFEEFSILGHLNSVKQTPELSDVYSACLSKLIPYSSALSQNKLLFNAIKTLSKNNDTFDYAQKACLDIMLKEFKFGGVDLSEADKKRYQIIEEELSELMNNFDLNVLNATDEYFHLVVDKAELKGLSESAMVSAEKAAQDKNLKGYLFTLQAPSYLPVLLYAENRKLRETLFTAQKTLASELGDKAYDNSRIMYDILKLRHEKSQLLGFKNYAELSLAENKMAETPEKVVDFLNDLGARAKPQALDEWRELRAFAFQRDNIETLQPWDLSFYVEKLREQKFAINHEALRAYFPLDKVLDGLFKLITHLFGMTIEELKAVNTWHSDVRCFSVADQHQQLRGHFYLDIYARPGKQAGAWMEPLQSRRRLSDGTIQTPIAFVVCDFDSPANATQPALLRHEEIVTLFHEMGHCLHQVVTQIDYPTVAGTNVLWDAVELPSQTMESFPEEKSILNIISAHQETGECLPGKVIDQMHKAKNFNSGLQLLRQVEMSLFDFCLHLEFDPSKGYEQIQNLADKLQRDLAVTPTSNFNRFQHQFTHIFAGGYAAGYYSYAWAELLSCDAFAKFLEEGLFNEKVGKLFLHTVLEQGGAKHPLVLFEEFRGRQPKLDALLSYRGIGQNKKTNLLSAKLEDKTDTAIAMSSPTPIDENLEKNVYKKDFYAAIDHDDVRRHGFSTIKGKNVVK
ncbi:MAG: M3 family metallopeptidase [Pseudomonadota bacterium]